MLDHLPIFPLGTVLFPGLILPLQVFEERYRQLVEDLARRPEPERRFGAIAIKAGREVGEEPSALAALHDVGCVAKVRQIDRLDDGRFMVTTTGAQRFRIRQLDRSRRYLQAQVELLPEPSGDVGASVSAAVTTAFTSYRAALTGSREEIDLHDDPELLSYVVAAAAILDVGAKQSLLEAPDTATRLKRELALLRRETALLTLLPSRPAIELARAETSRN